MIVISKRPALQRQPPIACTTQTATRTATATLAATRTASAALTATRPATSVQLTGQYKLCRG